MTPHGISTQNDDRFAPAREVRAIE